VAYTGTHDNDTTLGWWNVASKAEKLAVHAYIGELNSNSSPVWSLIRVVADSVAQLSIVPAQDLFELGSEARMNTPAVANGNWSWRVAEHSWTPELAAKLAAIADVTDRDNDPLAPPDEAVAEA
jgi:4-alpha-glucanotransferase